MFRETRKVMGRFVSSEAAAVNVAVTKTYGGIDPFEVILMRYSKDSKHPDVIQRVILDWTANNQAQGQNHGLHGEGNFTEERVKDLLMTSCKTGFSSADGQALVNIDFIIKEFRFVIHQKNILTSFRIIIHIYN